MKTDIPYLEKLEVDLRNAATTASIRRPPAKPRSAVWGRRLGVAAAVLVVAGVVGSVANNGGVTSLLGDASSTKFNQVGSAVGGAGGGADREPAAPIPARDFLDEEAEGQPQASPAPEVPAEEGQPGTDLAKIDRDGSLTLKIDEGSLGITFTDVIGIAEENGGMLLSSETVGSDTARLVLRVPANRFDRAFAEVSQLGEVRASTVTGTDVTADFIDLQARLRILKAHREVIFGLYDQATTIDTTLRLDRELNEVQLQIDQIQGQLRYLDAQTSISTLKVAMSENEPDVEALSEEDEAPSLGDAWNSATDGFLGVLSAMIVGLGYLIPLAIVAGIVVAVVRLVRRRDPGAS
jgi:hypothetical protein